MTNGNLLGPGQPDPLSYEHEIWAKASAANGVTAFEAKALYAAGLMRHLLEASGKCLSEPNSFHLPAYVLAVEAGEALGRCLTGDREPKKGSWKRLKTGLRAAMGPTGTITTPAGTTYDVDACYDLRNFTTHGGTTPKRTDVVDAALIKGVVRGLAARLDRYWSELATPSEPLRAQLEEALVRPLWTSGRVIFVSEMKGHVQNGGTPRTSLLYEET